MDAAVRNERLQVVAGGRDGAIARVEAQHRAARARPANADAPRLGGRLGSAGDQIAAGLHEHVTEPVRLERLDAAIDDVALADAVESQLHALALERHAPPAGAHRAVVDERQSLLDQFRRRQDLVRLKVFAVKREQRLDREVERSVALLGEIPPKAEQREQVIPRVVDGAVPVKAAHLAVLAVARQRRLEFRHARQRRVDGRAGRLRVVADDGEMESGPHQGAGSRGGARLVRARQPEFPGQPESAARGDDAEHLAAAEGRRTFVRV